VPIYLCDTNIVSEIMRREPDPAVLSWFRSQDSVALSAIVLEELVFGLRRKALYEKEAWLRRFVAKACVVHPVEAADAFWAAEKRGQLSAAGRTVHQADALIAAAAWRNGLVLATRNVRDFDGFGIALLDPFAS
jgi:predicted nucleic acid-binding protein